MDAIEAVIFDFGGVITTSPFERFAALERARGLPEGLVRQINSTNPDTNAWAQIERADIDRAAFDEAFAAEAAALGHELRGADVLACLSGTLRPGMVAALDTIRGAGMKLGCITNNAPAGQGPGMASDAEGALRLAPVFDRFDHVIESAKAGLRKPDPRIYMMMCEALEVVPAACVYLDDLGINCKPAAQLGMVAIKVTGEEQALRDLSQAIGIDLSVTEATA
ncbi:HAD-IA family hydrolase [Novosphingobium tardum]|uniref:HAD-IA family hydrolase n=1 Tax=Novosphingobium tardum TaxID=1538021 RepID=A0ABV8RJT9_9SPHN